MRYGASVLDKYGAPKLSELTACGAPTLADPPNYLGSFVLNSLFRVKYPDPVGRLVLIFGRRVIHAVHEYSRARAILSEYVQTLPKTNGHFLDAMRAATHFEHCIGSVCQADALVGRIVDITHPPETPSVDERMQKLRKIWNRSKHFDEDLVDRKVSNIDITAPVWLTNDGISSTTATITFVQLHSVLNDLLDILKSLTEDIPNQVAGRGT
jgi:hypothetical protein